jgi:hypothetical protein
MSEAQIKRMVDRFLTWSLPADFAPDGGISFIRPITVAEVEWWPTGTHLLTARQAEAMIRYLLLPEEIETAINELLLARDTSKSIRARQNLEEVISDALARKNTTSNSN